MFVYTLDIIWDLVDLLKINELLKSVKSEVTIPMTESIWLFVLIYWHLVAGPPKSSLDMF